MLEWNQATDAHRPSGLPAPGCRWCSDRLAELETDRGDMARWGGRTAVPEPLHGGCGAVVEPVHRHGDRCPVDSELRAEPVSMMVDSRDLISPGNVWTSWSLLPGVVAGLGLSAWLYLSGIRRLWRNAGTGHGVRRWEV